MSSFERLVLVAGIFALATLVMAVLGGAVYDALRRWWRRRGR